MAKWGGSTAGYSTGEAVTGSDNSLYVCVNAAGCRGPNPVGDSGTNWKHAASTPASDVTFASNTVGPVIVDTANGHTYRIRSTNDVVVLQQVT